MNIAIEDIKFLERFAKQEPCSGSVWRMAQEGKTYFEISVAVGHSKESDGVPRRGGHG